MSSTLPITISSWRLAGIQPGKQEVGKYSPTFAEDDTEKRALDEKRTNRTLSSGDYDAAIELRVHSRGRVHSRERY